MRVGSGYVFELWAERAKILGYMDLADRISAFLHLCFDLGLEYPTKAKYFCDFVQRCIADYDDDEGSNTNV